MNFLINKNVLKKALTHLCLLVQPARRKNLVPCLQYVRIERRLETIVLTTTNLDQRLNLELDVEGEYSTEDKNVCFINAKFLKSILPLFSSVKPVEIKSNEQMVSVKQGDFEFYKSYHESFHDDYPMDCLKDNDLTCVLEVKAGDFLKCLNTVMFATSCDETRLVLNGIYINNWEYGYKVVATDGRRLALVDLATSFAAGDLKLKISSSVLAVLVKRLKEADPDQTVSFLRSDETITFYWEGNELSGKIKSGEYPKYRQVIPSHQTYSIPLPKRALISSLKRSIKVSDNVKLDISSDCIKVVCESGLDSYYENIPIECKTPPTKLSFNNKFLLESLSHAVGDDLRLGFTDAIKPITIHGDGWLVVLMPLRS